MSTAIFIPPGSPAVGIFLLRKCLVCFAGEATAIADTKTAMASRTFTAAQKPSVSVSSAFAIRQGAHSASMSERRIPRASIPAKQTQPQRTAAVKLSQSAPSIRFASLSSAEQELALSKIADALKNNDASSPRWTDADAFRKGFCSLILELLARYDLPPSVAETAISEFCRGQAAEPVFWETVRKQVAADFVLFAATHPLRGAALRGIGERLKLASAIRQLGEQQIVPPPSAEELARREAQASAASDALGIISRVNVACDKLRGGEGLPRRPGCGCGSTVSLQHKIERHKFITSQYFCKTLGCPRCEAYRRTGIIEHAMRVLLFAVPDGGVPLSPQPSLPWRTGMLFAAECSDEQTWLAIRKQISRQASAVGAEGKNRLSQPGYIRRRFADGKSFIVTEAPLPGFRELRPAEAARLFVEGIGLSLFPDRPRRRGDVRFGGRWTPPRKKAEYERVTCNVTTDQAVALAEQCGVERIEPLPARGGLGEGVLFEFASPAAAAVDVARNGGDPIAAALEADQRIEAFCYALATGLVRFPPTSSSTTAARQKTDSRSEAAKSAIDEAFATSTG